VETEEVGGGEGKEVEEGEWKGSGRRGGKDGEGDESWGSTMVVEVRSRDREGKGRVLRKTTVMRAVSAETLR
jgi:hypothetical protein